MASFDVKSLFTNIPVEETCQIILNKYFPNTDSLHLGFDRKLFSKLLDLCTKNNIFYVNSQSYMQIDGAPMGACASSTLADIFLGYWEQIWLEECPDHFKPVFYRRYVDDTFLLFKSASHVNLFLDYLNSKHPNIEFTKECEVNGTLPFLDVLVSKVGERFETSLFRKKTFTGLGMKFDSCVPKSYKLNLISCLVNRAQKICSNTMNFNREIINIRKFFAQNKFPQTLVDTNIRRRVELSNALANPVATAEKCSVFFTLPFISVFSNKKLEREVLDLMQRFYPQLKVILIFKNNFTIGRFFNYKDRIPTPMQSNIVYQYTCGACAATYCGETSRHLSTRIAEHKGVSPRTGLPTANPKSNIYNHFLETGHPIHKSNFNVLFTSNSSKLKIAESIIIKQSKPNLNNHDSSIPLNILG